jgi:hypothetical protein
MVLSVISTVWADVCPTMTKGEVDGMELSVELQPARERFVTVMGCCPMSHQTIGVISRDGYLELVQAE